MRQLGLFTGEPEDARLADAVDDAVDLAISEIRLLASSSGLSRRRIGRAVGNRDVVAKILRDRNPGLRTIARVAVACNRRLVVSFADASGRPDSVDDRTAAVLREVRALLVGTEPVRRVRKTTEAISRVVGDIDALLGRR